VPLTGEGGGVPCSRGRLPGYLQDSWGDVKLPGPVSNMRNLDDTTATIRRNGQPSDDGDKYDTTTGGGKATAGELYGGRWGPDRIPPHESTPY